MRPELLHSPCSFENGCVPGDTWLCTGCGVITSGPTDPEQAAHMASCKRAPQPEVSRG